MATLPRALDGVRVLDLAGSLGWYATRLLADLGADVLRVEPPGGDPQRQEPPLARFGGIDWWWFNLGKRSTVLDLDTSAGQEALRVLASEADVLVETFTPGWLAARGLGSDDLARTNPGLVVTSVTPFGQNGPHSGWRGGDLIGLATSGLLHLSGCPDRPPSQPGVTLGAFHAGLVAAAATLVALRGRDRSGRGQHVDVSLQESLIAATENSVPGFDLMGHDRSRMGGRTFTGDDLYFKAADGWLAITLGKRWVSVLSLLQAAGMPGDDWDQPEWFDTTYRESRPNAMKETLTALAAGRPRRWLMETAQRLRMAAASVQTVADLAGDPQLAARDYWLDVEQPGIDPRLVRIQSAPFKMSATPWQVSRPAPTPGEHDGQGWIGEWPTPRSVSAGGLPLSGLRVVDFAWVVAGPAATQVLADFGAEVIRIESAARPDGLRAMPFPRALGAEGPNRSGIYNIVNTSKRSVALDLTTETGREIARDLIRLADVVVDNFGVDPFPKWGLSADALRRLNPDLIVARSSGMGRSGPDAAFVGLGWTTGSYAGLHALGGFPGDPPVGTCTAHPDYSPNPYHLLVAILAALHYRDQTGQGQTIDLSQHESTAVFNGPAIAAYSMLGIVPASSANRHPHLVPHGVYRCRGNDRWVAIACERDDDWGRLAKTIGRPDLAADDALTTAAGRRAHADAIDAAIERWTRLRTPDEAAEALQVVGVAAGAVQSVHDLFRDPHLAARGQFVRVRHPEAGLSRLNGPTFRLSGAPVQLRPAPLLGQDGDAILGELLGMDDVRRHAAAAEGALV
ncbi:MAG: CoA transferase [Dehalococcoidia bacterium]